MAATGRQISLNKDTFPCAAAAAIVKFRGVVFDGTTRGNVKLPAATPELTFAGITTSKQSNANNVEVITHGQAVVESDGTAVINPGDRVILGGGADGRVKSKALADGATVYEIIGICVDKAQIPATAGALCTIRLQPQVVPLT